MVAVRAALRSRRALAVAVALAACAAVAWVLYANAWIVDDAYITFRTVDNFVHGRGMTWNPGERVQVFTHPLWMLLVSGLYLCTRELFYTVHALSMVLTVAALLVAVRVQRPLGARALLVVVAALSGKAVMDFASSGLEGPLSYLLLALAFGEVVPATEPPRLRRLALLASLAFVNRPDTILFYVPLLAWCGVGSARRQGSRATMRALLVGALPAIAWLVYALVYFGFPFPNTFYAKITTGAPLGDRLARGLLYLGNSLAWDPGAHALFLVATICAVSAARKRPAVAAFTAGLWVYYGFAIANACATHMSGRLFSVVLFGAVLVAAALVSPPWTARLSIVLVGYTLLHPRAPWKMGGPAYGASTTQHESRIDTNWFVHQEGLTLRPLRTDHPWLQQGRAFSREGARVRLGGVWEAVGYFGFAAGPDKTIIDPVGLTDPLVARLPACNVDDPAHWKSGHFYRDLPAGYLASRALGGDRIIDPALHRYYARLDRVTRGPIFDLARLRDILALNLTERTAPAPPSSSGDCRARVWSSGAELDALKR